MFTPLQCNEPYYTGDDTNCGKYIIKQLYVYAYMVWLSVYIVEIINPNNAFRYDCSQGIDVQFGIRWESTRKNSNTTGACPNGTGITRYIIQ